MTDRRPARAAMAEGWPVLLTSVVVGLTYGIAARQAGLSVVEASASSLIVFAGAAQFAMLDLLRDGASAPVIAVTIFLVNARHLLMAAAIRAFLAHVAPGRRLGLAYVLTDEAFAMGIGWFRRGHRAVSYYAVFGIALWLCWNLATIAGAIVGSGVEHPERFGVDFAITAVFVAIVAVSARHRIDLAVALAAALVAAAVRIAGASTLAVVIAGAIAPLGAVAFGRDER